MGLPQENAILLLLCKIGFDEIQQIVNITIERRLKNFEIKMGVIMDQDVPKSFHVAKGKVGMRKKEFFAHSSSNFAKLFKNQKRWREPPDFGPRTLCYFLWQGGLSGFLPGGRTFLLDGRDPVH